jgi:hypothetical protein
MNDQSIHFITMSEEEDNEDMEEVGGTSSDYFDLDPSKQEKIEVCDNMRRNRQFCPFHYRHERPPCLHIVDSVHQCWNELHCTNYYCNYV